MIHPCCLTIAGSDSGGNAGIQADLRTFHAYHLHGCSVLTAITAQNPEAVTAIHPVPTPIIDAQLNAILRGYNVCALKTGMLHQPQTIECIAHHLQKLPHIAKIIDPVMIATSGAPLMTLEAVKVLKQHLLHLATLLTPNRLEAETLTNITISDLTSAKAAAQRLHETYGAAIILKGGHFDSKQAIDILYDGNDFTTVAKPRILHPISTHGTGCTFAAALTACLARGYTLVEAFQNAKRHIHAVIEKSYYVGSTYGVLGFQEEA